MLEGRSEMKRIALVIVFVVVAVGLFGDDDLFVPPYGSYRATEAKYDGVDSWPVPLIVLKIMKGYASFAVDLDDDGHIGAGEIATFAITDLGGKIYSGNLGSRKALISYSPQGKMIMMIIASKEAVSRRDINSGIRLIFSAE